jgi:hypothetical protein
MGDNPHLRPGALPSVGSVEGSDEIAVDASESSLGEGTRQGAGAALTPHIRRRQTTR